MLWNTYFFFLQSFTSRPGFLTLLVGAGFDLGWRRILVLPLYLKSPVSFFQGSARVWKFIVEYFPKSRSWEGNKKTNRMPLDSKWGRGQCTAQLPFKKSYPTMLWYIALANFHSVNLPIVVSWHDSSYHLLNTYSLVSRLFNNHLFWARRSHHHRLNIHEPNVIQSIIFRNQKTAKSKVYWMERHNSSSFLEWNKIMGSLSEVMKMCYEGWMG